MGTLTPMPRKSDQDKAFDKALRLLPALSNDDLAVIVVACNNIVQAREKAKRRALTPQHTSEESTRVHS